MATRLRNLKVKEVSLCDRGANPEAHILLYKAQTKTVDGKELPASAFAYIPDPEKPSTWKLRIDDAQHVGAAAAALGPGYRGQKVAIPAADRAKVLGRVRAAWRRHHKGADDSEMPKVLKAMSFNDALAADDARDQVNELWRRTDTMMDVIRSIMSDDEVDDKRAAIEESLGQFGDWVKSAVSKAGGSMDIKEIEKTLAEQEEKIAKLEGELGEAVKRAEAAEQEAAKLRGDDPPGDGIDKSELPEAVRKYLEKQEAEAAELRKRADANDEELRKMREAREQDAVLAKVKTDYPNLPNKEEIAKTLQKLEGDERERLEKILRQSNESMKGALKSLGGGEEGEDVTALEEATAKAQELMAANPGKYKSVESARAAVWKANPTLHKRYSSERTAQH